MIRDKVKIFVFFVGMAALNCSGSTDSIGDAEPVIGQEPSDDSPEEESSGEESGGEEPTGEGPEGESDQPSDQEEISSSPIIPTTAENWTVVYNGYGSVVFDEEEGIIMEPMAATSAGETHSALVLAKITEECPVADFSLTVEAVTEEQLRSGDPNPWEVFWIFFNYLPSGDDKTTNYFILKTNGIELGRAFDETGQEFLFTAGGPQLTVGTANTFVLEKTGNLLTVFIDGTEVLNYTGGELPDALYDTPGSIGLYTEDARVKINSVMLESDELVPCL